MRNPSSYLNNSLLIQHISGQKCTTARKLLSFIEKIINARNLILPLTLNATCISESCIEIKINFDFYFHTSLWCLKRLIMAFKAFLKPLETAAQRSVKMKI